MHVSVYVSKKLEDIDVSKRNIAQAGCQSDVMMTQPVFYCLFNIKKWTSAADVLAATTLFFSDTTVL